MATTIDQEELRAMMDAGRDLVIAEVLPRANYEGGHIPGAVHLPLEGIEQAVRSLAPDRERELVLYCSGPTCQNSHTAAARLEGLGYRAVRVFGGGKAEWKRAGHALEVSR